MITPYTAMTEIDINEIDRIIAELEEMLAGNLDESNIAVSDSGKLIATTDSVNDLDGYLESMFMIGAFPTDLYNSLSKLAVKMDGLYDLTSVSLKALLHRDAKDSRTSGQQGYDERTEKNTSDNRPSWATSTESWIATINSTAIAQKPSDYGIVTYEQFFLTIFNSLSDTDDYVNVASFVEKSCYLYNVKEFETVMNTRISLLCSKCDGRDLIFILPEPTVGVNEVFASYVFAIRDQVGETVDEDYAFDIEVDTSILLNRFI